MRLIVVGTGTDVGKTHVAACLLAHARATGSKARAYKPVATGVVGRCEDAERHAAALGLPYVPPSFAYARAVSPHLAAREEARPIDLDAIRATADAMAADADVLLVETAGGLFTPLGDAQTNADLVRQLLPGIVVLVAADRLGALHDVRACNIAARACGITFGAIVVSAPLTPDASTGTNAAELSRLGLGPVAGAFPRAPFDSAESESAAVQLLDALRRARRGE